MPLSAKQMEYLALAFACFESEPKIDFEKFHRLAGLKSANSARELMRTTKIKLKAEYGGAAAPNGGSDAGTPAKTTPSKAAPAAKGTPTPKRTRAAAPPKAKKAKTEVKTEVECEDEEVEEDEAAPPAAKKAKTNAVNVAQAVVEEDEGDFLL